MNLSKQQQYWVNGLAAALVLIVFYILSIGPSQFVATSLSKHGHWKDTHQDAWETIYGPMNFASGKWPAFGRVTEWLINKGHKLAQ